MLLGDFSYLDERSSLDFYHSGYTQDSSRFILRNTYILLHKIQSLLKLMKEFVKYSNQ